LQIRISTYFFISTDAQIFRLIRDFLKYKIIRKYMKKQNKNMITAWSENVKYGREICLYIPKVEGMLG
jgi:hypothetical protein